MSLETHDAKDRVTFTTVTNGFIDDTVLLCRFLTRGILQFFHPFLHLAMIDQREAWYKKYVFRKNKNYEKHVGPTLVEQNFSGVQFESKAQLGIITKKNCFMSA